MIPFRGGNLILNDPWVSFQSNQHKGSAHKDLFLVWSDFIQLFLSLNERNLNSSRSVAIGFNSFIAVAKIKQERCQQWHEENIKFALTIIWFTQEKFLNLGFGLRWGLNWIWMSYLSRKFAEIQVEW